MPVVSSLSLRGLYLSSPQPKLQELGLGSSCHAKACSVGSHQAGKVDEVQEGCLDQLNNGQRAFYTHKRLFGESKGALGRMGSAPG
jgi:hypothetical protein